MDLESLLIYSILLVFPVCFLLMRRFGKQRRIGAALLVFGFMLAYGVGLAFLISSLQVARLSSEARAEVVGVEDRDCDSVRGDVTPNQEITYRFSADGQAYEGSACWNKGAYDPAADYKVCYDPADPEGNRLTDATTRCGEEF